MYKQACSNTVGPTNYNEAFPSVELLVSLELLDSKVLLYIEMDRPRNSI